MYIGKVKCNSKVFTPDDLYGLEKKEKDNILRTLQSLDNDGNPDNGIQLEDVDTSKITEYSNKKNTVDFDNEQSLYDAIYKINENKAVAFSNLSASDARQHMESYLNSLDNIKTVLIEAVKNSDAYLDTNTDFKMIFDKLIINNSIHLVQYELGGEGNTWQGSAISPYRIESEIGDIFIRIDKSNNWITQLNDYITGTQSPTVLAKKELLIGTLIHEVQHVVDYNSKQFDSYTTFDTEANAHALEYRYYLLNNLTPSDIVGSYADEKKKLYDYIYNNGTKSEASVALKDMGYSIVTQNKKLNGMNASATAELMSGTKIYSNNAKYNISVDFDKKEYCVEINGNQCSSITITNTTTFGVEFYTYPKPNPTCKHSFSGNFDGNKLIGSFTNPSCANSSYGTFSISN